MTEDWILRGRDWLESCQNDDGGWGETCASYENPDMKGKGTSTASQTAWALMGICACGDLDRNERAARPALSPGDATPGWRVGRAGNYRHRFPARLLFKVRHVSTEFSPPRARHLRELPQWHRPLPELLPLDWAVTAVDVSLCAVTDAKQRPGFPTRSDAFIARTPAFPAALRAAPPGRAATARSSRPRTKSSPSSRQLRLP